MSGSLRTFPFCFLAALTLAGFTGCGGEPFKHVQVSGTVTYDDGSVIPVEFMELTFQPQAEAVDKMTHPRPGHAGVDVATGEFNNATTHKPGDGLVAGKHKVKITAYDASQNVSKAIPAEYMDISTTPLELDTANSPWNITIKRPAQ
jgi:hypothetical protein